MNVRYRFSALEERIVRNFHFQEFKNYRFFSNVRYRSEGRFQRKNVRFYKNLDLYGPNHPDGIPEASSFNSP